MDLGSLGTHLSLAQGKTLLGSSQPAQVREPVVSKPHLWRAGTGSVSILRETGGSDMGRLRGRSRVEWTHSRELRVLLRAQARPGKQGETGHDSSHPAVTEAPGWTLRKGTLQGKATVRNDWRRNEGHLWGTATSSNVLRLSETKTVRGVCRSKGGKRREEGAGGCLPKPD